VDDVPVFGKPLSLNEPVPLPSGEVVNRIMIHAKDMTLEKNARIVETAGAGTLLTFMDSADRASAVVSVEQKGNYNVFIRYMNGNEDAEQINVSVNNRRADPVNVTITDRFCGMTVITLPLEEGKNLLTFSSVRGVRMNLIILDRTPVR